MMSRTDRSSVCAVWLSVAVILWALLYFLDGDLLWRIESRSLFLFTSLFAGDSLRIPGGFIGWTGAFFQQFLYLPWLGALVKVTFWGLSAFLFLKVTALKGWGALWVSLPVAALVSFDMQWGYSIFQPTGQGFFFAADIGVIYILLSLLFCRSMKSTALKITAAVVWTLLGYSLFGGWCIAGSLLMALGFLKIRRIRGAAAVSLSGIAAPFVWMPFFHSVTFRNAFMAALPAVPFGMSYTCMIPLAVEALCLSAAVLVNFDSFRAGRTLVTVSGMVTAAASIAFAAFFWYEDANFRAENAMCRALENGSWEEIVRIHSETTASFEKYNDEIQKKGGVRTDEYYAPTRAMVLLKNLALFKLGSSCAGAFSYKDGSCLPKDAPSGTMMYESGKQLFYHYGLLTFCWRWTTEDYVQNGWNAEDLKYLTRVSIAAGDSAAAVRYVDQLEHTLFHRRWAADQKRYISHPLEMAASDEYADILEMRGDEDLLDTDRGSLELYLSDYFTRTHTDVSPRFREASLLWAMQSQSVSKFRQAFSGWLESHPGQPVPRNCQEALYLYSRLEGGFDMSSFTLDSDIPELYESFMAYSRYHPFRDPQEQTQTYWRRFGKTFFYFYYFIRDLKTY